MSSASDTRSTPRRGTGPWSFVLPSLAAILLAAAALLIAPGVPPPEGAGAPEGNPGSVVAPVKPPPLRPGDTIYLVAPAGPVNESKLREAAANLSRLGYGVKATPRALGKERYLAGSDEARASELNQALSDPEARMVLCLRGGYGSPRLLDRIDYEAVRRDPKIIAGYSDITALLIAVRQKSNVVTFHAPMAATDFSGKYGLAPFSSRHFFALVEGAGDKESTARLYRDWGGDAPETLGVRRRIAPGAAEGSLTGGNLSTVAALMGTPYEIDTAGAILFLEDVNEEPFRIDRMLCQLRLAGKLAGCRGVLLGAFTQCEPRSKDRDESFTTDQVLDHYFAGLGIPVLAGFPAGHLPDQAALPFGSRVRLDADRMALEILEPPVAAGTAAGDAR